MQQKELIVRFCPPEEVNQKRQKFQVFKGGFLAKLMALKLKGQKQETMSKLENYFSDEIETYYQMLLKIKKMPSHLLNSQQKELLSYFPYERLGSSKV